MSNSLKSKIVKGGLFLGLSNIFTQIASIVVNLILAKLLYSHEFGLIALASTFIGFITMVFNVGFGSSVIHFKNSKSKQVSTLYYLNYVIGIFTFLVVYFSSRLAAVYYENDDLELLVKISSFSILITPFFITHFKILERDLEFQKISKIIVSSTVISSVLSIFAALNDFGVYSFVVQSLSMAFCKMVFTLIYSKWKPIVYFNVREVQHMIWYSVKFRIAKGFLYFERNIDYLILGKLFNPMVLGYYSFSYNIMYTPVKRVSNIFADVLFPSLSSIKDEPKRIIEVYFKSMQLVGMVSFPIMTLISLNADWLVIALFGEKWHGAIAILQVLCFAGAFQSISQFGTVVLDSIGKPEYTLYVSFIRGVLVVLAILFGSQYNILTVCYLILLVKILGWIVLLFVIKRNISFKISRLLYYLKGVFISVVAVLGLNLVLLICDFQIYFAIKFVFEVFVLSGVVWAYYKTDIKKLVSILIKNK